MKRVGKKTRAWTNARNRLKKIFEANSVTTCELRYPGCWVDNALSFAHSRRRRFIKDNEMLMEVVLACTYCHKKLDEMSHEATYETVTKIIEQRETK